MEIICTTKSQYLFPFHFWVGCDIDILVHQVGIPVDREQYIHRLGRTGREGKDGEGILLIAPWEEYFLDGLKDLPIQKCDLPYLDPNITAKVCILIPLHLFKPCFCFIVLINSTPLNPCPQPKNKLRKKTLKKNGSI